MSIKWVAAPKNIYGKWNPEQIQKLNKFHEVVGPTNDWECQKKKSLFAKYLCNSVCSIFLTQVFDDILRMNINDMRVLYNNNNKFISKE